MLREKLTALTVKYGMLSSDMEVGGHLPGNQVARELRVHAEACSPSPCVLGQVQDSTSGPRFDDLCHGTHTLLLEEGRTRPAATSPVGHTCRVVCQVRSQPLCQHTCMSTLLACAAISGCHDRRCLASPHTCHRSRSRPAVGGRRALVGSVAHTVGRCPETPTRRRSKRCRRSMHAARSRPCPPLIARRGPRPAELAERLDRNACQ